MKGNFGKYLQILRHSKGVTVRQLSNMIFISASHISNIENGRRRPPKDDILKSMSKALGLTDIEERQFFFLAEKEKQISNETLDYMSENDMSARTVDLAREYNFTNDDWAEIIDFMRTKH